MIHEEHNIRSIRQKFKEKGVFYTDAKLAQIMKGYIDIPYRNVYDPTCGDGSLLSVFDDDIQKFGQEIDTEQAEEARKRLCNCTIYDGDTLAEPKGMEQRYDVVIANPPFSICWNPTFDERFNECGVLAPKSKADYAFILHCLYVLKDTGMAIILCFPGILYRGNSEGKIRKWFIENKHIERIVRIPKGYFVDTNIETDLLILRKSSALDGIIFEDITLKKQRKVSYDEIKENGYTLSVNTYVQEEIIKEVINPIELQEQCRKSMLLKLKRDILADMEVCELERWDKYTYIDKIKDLINDIRGNVKVD